MLSLASFCASCFTAADKARFAALEEGQKQLAQTVAYVDKAAAAQAPRGSEVNAVRTQLEAAIKSLPAVDAAKG